MRLVKTSNICSPAGVCPVGLASARTHEWLLSVHKAEPRSQYMVCNFSVCFMVSQTLLQLQCGILTVRREEEREHVARIGKGEPSFLDELLRVRLGFVLASACIDRSNTSVITTRDLHESTIKCRRLCLCVHVRNSERRHCSYVYFLGSMKRRSIRDPRQTRITGDGTHLLSIFLSPTPEDVHTYFQACVCVCLYPVINQHTDLVCPWTK